MRVLISGGAGFIGSHLTDALLAAGDEVLAVDNFLTGRRENIAHLHSHPRYRLIEHDVTAPLDLDGPLDRIFHLASPASPRAYEQHRLATMKVNSQGTWNLLELAVAKNARFLVASTSEIYGDPQYSPQKEEYWGNTNPIGLRSVYEEAKRFSEAITMAYHREKHADTRIIRPFNTYGPRLGLHDGRVITNFVVQALSNEPLTVYGDGTQKRSLCYIEDLVAGMRAAMEADFHEPINLGNPEEVTIVQLARDILELCPGTHSKIVFQPSPDYDPRVRKPDITRAKQILGWTPKIHRKQGLAEVVKYYRQTLKK